MINLFTMMMMIFFFPCVNLVPQRPVLFDTGLLLAVLVLPCRCFADTRAPSRGPCRMEVSREDAREFRHAGLCNVRR